MRAPSRWRARRSIAAVPSGLLNSTRVMFRRMAAEHESTDRTAEEISQLLYHLQVLMIARGLDLDAVYRYL